MKVAIVSSKIESQLDVVAARQRARELARLLGADLQDQIRLATAVSEIARNAFEYAGRGEAAFSVLEGPELRIEVVIRDQGPGIQNLEEIFAGRYVSAHGLGLGIIGAKRLVDEFSIEPGPARGTVVRLVKGFPGVLRPTAASLPTVSDRLVSGVDQDPLAELRFQNDSLARAYEILQTKQAELAELNQELEATNRGVVALYSELEEKAEALKSVNAAKTRFLSSITHELRTPLGSMLSLSDLLIDGQEGPLTEGQTQVTRLIKKSARDLLDLVNDLLDLAKVDAGKLTVKPSPFSLADTFSSLRSILRPLAQTFPNVNLQFVEPGPVKLFTDEGKLNQILRNLISNGLKYTPAGEVVVSGALDGDTLVLSVRDTGIGIGVEDQSRIFEEFTQIESAQQRKHAGTGLGLSLTRRFAEILGGSVSLSSELGHGSTFTVRLPAHYRDLREAPTLPARIQTPPAPAGPRPAPRFLIIDDEPSERDFLADVLTSLYRSKVETATDGETGLALARAHRPSAIFLDLHMAPTDGFRVYQELRADPTLREIPVLVHTSKLLRGDDRDRLAGVRGFLPKAMTSEEDLIRRLKVELGSIGIEAGLA